MKKYLAIFVLLGVLYGCNSENTVTFIPVPGEEHSWSYSFPAAHTLSYRLYAIHNGSLKILQSGNQAFEENSEKHSLRLSWDMPLPEENRGSTITITMDGVPYAHKTPILIPQLKLDTPPTKSTFPIQSWHRFYPVNVAREADMIPDQTLDFSSTEVQSEFIYLVALEVMIEKNEE